MTALALVAGAVVVRPVGFGLAILSSEKSIGLLNFVSLPVWVKFTAGFLLMDLT